MEKTAKEVEEIKKHYHANLKPDEYFKTLETAFQETEQIFITSLTALHKLMKSRRFKGSKLLEIGSGPTVHHIASASAYFTEIVQSDFVEANCEELRKWLRGESQLDWTRLLKVVAEIEGIDDPNSGLREIENRIRTNVKSVVRCDVLSDEVIPQEVVVEYDVIITALTIESAATDLKNYVAILKRLNRLLRPGGGLFMAGFINGGKWSTDSGEFHYLRVTQEDIDKALDESGFAQKDWIVVPKKKETQFYEYEAYYCVASTKV